MHKSLFYKFTALICLLALLLGGCSMRQTGSPGDDVPAVNVDQPTPGAQPEDPGKQPDEEAGEDEPSSPSDVGDPTEYPSTNSDLPPTEEPEGGYTGPDLAAREKVEDDFFDDAVFFGNSLVNGLELYGQMKGGDFCAATSASVISVTSTLNATLSNGGAGTLLDKMLEKEYGKIYILLGINEIGFNTDYFADVYGQMLQRIKDAQPEATIYIMSLTPVTKAKSDAGAPFTMDRIREYNEALYKLAEEYQCYYVDLVEALADSSGYLPAADSTDGVHFIVSKYPVWADYLRTHYAGDPDDVKRDAEPEAQWTPPEEPQTEPEPSPEPDPEPEETPTPGTGTDLVPEE